jgi:Skp family chaperone for outer membrane proteins
VLTFASMKVAVVDVVKVLDESKEGLAGAKRLEALFQEQQRELAPLMQQARAKKDPKLHKQIEDTMREHEQAREKLRADLRDSLLQKVKPLVDKTAAARGVDFVLARPQAMLFAKAELDLTGDVIAALDA